MSENRIDITQPLWDQNTFVGRFKHFAWITDPRSGFASETNLHEAKELYLNYK